MNWELTISELENEWDFEHGFFGILRRGIFDSAALQRLIYKLNAITLLDESQIHRRVVSLLWYMPLSMEWQRESVQESGFDIAEFDKAANLVQSSVERLLGVP